jgi:hypothetical protein
MRALQVLADAAPIQADKVPALLQDRGVTRVAFALESVIAAANDLHIDAPIQIEVARGIRFATRPANATHFSAILITARKKAGASGVVSANDIAADVSRRSKIECLAENVTRTLLASGKFRNLCGSWFWATDLPERRNRLVNVCKNMLSATSPISVSRLRAPARIHLSKCVGLGQGRSASSAGRCAAGVPTGSSRFCGCHRRPCKPCTSNRLSRAAWIFRPHYCGRSTKHSQWCARSRKHYQGMCRSRTQRTDSEYGSDLQLSARAHRHEHLGIAGLRRQPCGDRSAP